MYDGWIARWHRLLLGAILFFAGVMSWADLYHRFYPTALGVPRWLFILISLAVYAVPVFLVAFLGEIVIAVRVRAYRISATLYALLIVIWLYTFVFYFGRFQ